MLKFLKILALFGFFFAFFLHLLCLSYAFFVRIFWHIFDKKKNFVCCGESVRQTKKMFVAVTQYNKQIQSLLQ